MRIEHTEVCPACKGTGLYRGMAERDGFAVVCNQCKGTGAFRYVHEYDPFVERRPSAGVSRVVETNPGICLGDGPGLDFGGLPYRDWAEGKPFPVGSEMRNYACPRWWTQCRGGQQFECNGSLGVSFPNCRKFANKDECWREYDEQSSKR